MNTDIIQTVNKLYIILKQTIKLTLSNLTPKSIETVNYDTYFLVDVVYDATLDATDKFIESI
jgi:hypothetical protein